VQHQCHLFKHSVVVVASFITLSPIGVQNIAFSVPLHQSSQLAPFMITIGVSG